MIKPILKQRSDARMQGLYLAQGRDVPVQTFRCYIASADRPSVNQKYWIEMSNGDLVKVSIDFVNLDKELPQFLAISRLQDDQKDGAYRSLTLLAGDTAETAMPVYQDNSGMIWEMILSV